MRGQREGRLAQAAQPEARELERLQQHKVDVDLVIQHAQRKIQLIERQLREKHVVANSEQLIAAERARIAELTPQSKKLETEIQQMQSRLAAVPASAPVSAPQPISASSSPPPLPVEEALGGGFGEKAASGANPSPVSAEAIPGGAPSAGPGGIEPAQRWPVLQSPYSALNNAGKRLFEEQYAQAMAVMPAGHRYVFDCFNQKQKPEDLRALYAAAKEVERDPIGHDVNTWANISKMAEACHTLQTGKKIETVLQEAASPRSSADGPLSSSVPADTLSSTLREVDALLGESTSASATVPLSRRSRAYSQEDLSASSFNQADFDALFSSPPTSVVSPALPPVLPVSAAPQPGAVPLEPGVPTAAQIASYLHASKTELDQLKKRIDQPTYPQDQSQAMMDYLIKARDILGNNIAGDIANLGPVQQAELQQQLAGLQQELKQTIPTYFDALARNFPAQVVPSPQLESQFRAQGYLTGASWLDKHLQYYGNIFQPRQNMGIPDKINYLRLGTLFLDQVASLRARVESEPPQARQALLARITQMEQAVKTQAPAMLRDAQAHFNGPNQGWWDRQPLDLRQIQEWQAEVNLRMVEAYGRHNVAPLPPQFTAQQIKERELRTAVRGFESTLLNPPGPTTSYPERMHYLRQGKKFLETQQELLRDLEATFPANHPDRIRMQALVNDTIPQMLESQVPRIIPEMASAFMAREGRPLESGMGNITELQLLREFYNLPRPSPQPAPYSQENPGGSVNHAISKTEADVIFEKLVDLDRAVKRSQVTEPRGELKEIAKFSDHTQLTIDRGTGRFSSSDNSKAAIDKIVAAAQAYQSIPSNANKVFKIDQGSLEARQKLLQALTSARPPVKAEIIQPTPTLGMRPN